MTASSDDNPVSLIIFAAVTDMTPAMITPMIVPRIAAKLFLWKPAMAVMVNKVMTVAMKMVVVSGFQPIRIAGSNTLKIRTTVKVIVITDLNPFVFPMRINIAKKANTNTLIIPSLEKSDM